MAGSGYNIPVSLSVADSFSVPQSQVSPTYFNFGANSKLGGDIDSSPQSYAPATATSSAALGNASASTAEQNAGGFFGGKGGKMSKQTKMLLAVSVVLTVLSIGVTIYYVKHHK